MRKSILAAFNLAGKAQFAGMTNWTVTYLRHVLDETGLKGAELAARAGVSASTINRPLSSPDWPNMLSLKTLRAISKATGLPYNNFEPEGAPALFDAAIPPPKPARAAVAADDQGGDISITIDGKRARIVADITSANVDEVRRKLDLIRALLKG